AVDVDGNEVIDYIYAGDLQGNMWKFDVTSSNAAQWKVDYSGTPVFKATQGTIPQPITARPEVGEHPEGGYFVYFGTGRYVGVGDNIAAGAITQTFYGIWDNGAAVTDGRTNLLQQKILAETSNSFGEWRLTTDFIPAWTGGGAKKGWYMDLYNTEASNTNNYGEKQVSNPVLFNKRLIFTTLVPSSAICSAGGFSWLMELNPETGARLDASPFNVNGDSGFSVADKLSKGSVTDRYVSGKKLSNGIAGTPAIVYDPATKAEHKYLSQSDGTISEVGENSGSGGRVSWREIMNNN
ncbi:MAG: PilC/PilY family type IV pilus protein, partial [Sedimentisphaerales bacterium]|nr:PilC/PilY family type IV pilus protein [Sedimentisphaerales bacterium]